MTFSLKLWATTLGLFVICSSWCGALVRPVAHELAQPDDVEIEAVLAAARTALGWEVVQDVAAVRVFSEVEVFGTDAQDTATFDRRGRWVRETRGALPGVEGSDAERCWAVDWSGMPTPVVLGDRARLETDAALSFGFWAVPGGALMIESLARDEREITLGFRHRAGILTGELVLDARSHLPLRASADSGYDIEEWSFGSFLEHEGLRFTGSLQSVEGGAKFEQRTQRIELLEELDDALFAPRLTRPDDVRFDPEIAAAIETRRAPTGHLLVRPEVDGQDVGWFLFDTGAGSNCIASDVAARLGSEILGQIPAMGVGGTVMSQFRRAETLQLGPVSVLDPIFVELDLDFLEQPFGVKVAGVLGYDFLMRCVVEFDVSASELRLHDSRSYELPAGAKWEEVLLHSRHTCVRGRFEGREAVFKIDTGAAGDTVTLHAETVARLGLLEERETRPSRAGGVGGSIRLRVGKLRSFELGGHEFGEIPASFATEDEGAFGDAYTDGNIGGLLLEPFVLVFDHAQQRLGFLPKSDS